MQEHVDTPFAACQADRQEGYTTLLEAVYRAVNVPGHPE